MKKAANWGGLYHFKPNVRCLLLAQSGYSDRTREWPIREADNYRHWREVAWSRLTQRWGNRPAGGGADRGRGGRGGSGIEGAAASCPRGSRSRNRVLESMQGPSATAAAPRSDPPVPVGASWMEKAIKSSFLMFAGYNTWANGRLYDRNLTFTVLREGN